MMDAKSISALRSSLEISRALLAQFLGVSDMSVARWESGDATPGRLQLILIDAMQKAAERDAESVKALVDRLVVGHGEAIRRLLNLAYGEES